MRVRLHLGRPSLRHHVLKEGALAADSRCRLQSCCTARLLRVCDGHVKPKAQLFLPQQLRAQTFYLAMHICCVLREVSFLSFTAGAGLRHVAHALLMGAEVKQRSAAEALTVGDKQSMNGDAVAPSAMYIRDRVGVPRDLPLPAARQLRAHLNWLIDMLMES